MAACRHGRLLRRLAGLAGQPGQAARAGPEEPQRPWQPLQPRKLSLVFPPGGAESDDSSTEIASTAGSDDESPSEDASPVGPPPFFSREETLVIFDWDDTLLPTSWLRQHGYLHRDDVCNEEHLARLQDLAEAALQTLHAAHDFGKVVIVTNAEAGWVQLSCKKFLPGLVAALGGFDIISARSAYESCCAKSPSDWKMHAFVDTINSYYGKHQDNLFWNVIALGDSKYEQQALSYATFSEPTCHAKFVKFAARPSLHELTTEHERVRCCFRTIVDHDGDLHLRVPWSRDDAGL